MVGEISAAVSLLEQHGRNRKWLERVRQHRGDESSRYGKIEIVSTAQMQSGDPDNLAAIVNHGRGTVARTNRSSQTNVVSAVEQPPVAGCQARGNSPPALLL